MRDAEKPVVDVVRKAALDLVGHRLTLLDLPLMLCAIIHILFSSTNTYPKFSKVLRCCEAKLIHIMV
jgi:hypothetical protein